MGLFSSVGAIAGGSLLGNILGGDAAAKAAGRSAQARVDGINNANNTLQIGFDESLEYLLPQLEQDTLARNSLQDLAGLNGQEGFTRANEQFQNSPGFQFALNRGSQAIDASASAAGNRFSGNTLKRLQSFGQNLQNQDFNNYFNRQATLLRPNAANNLASLRTNLATNTANNLRGIGEARSDGIINKSNAFTNTLNNTNSLMNFAAGRF